MTFMSDLGNVALATESLSIPKGAFVRWETQLQSVALQTGKTAQTFSAIPGWCSPGSSAFCVSRGWISLFCLTVSAAGGVKLRYSAL